MKRKIELLAPGGDLDSIKAAIVAGADAIYCGLNNFNARNRATNIEFDDLNGILRLAHAHDCQVFLTVNILIVESEFKALVRLLNRLVNTDLDGIIVQDLGLLYLLSKYFKSLEIHASTQLTTHNEGQLKFLGRLTATRVNLSRELSLAEIKDLTQVAHDNQLEAEVFVHGSNCLSFSGLCYISSVLEGKSGNRGRCSQPCREQYATTAQGRDFPLNLKDNSAFNDLEALAAAGVDSLKIEGRVKKFHYVYTVVNSWRKLLDNFSNYGQPRSDDTDLYRVFNRDFSNAYLQGAIGKEMYIDNPRDNSAIYHSGLKGCATPEGITEIKQELYAARSAIIRKVEAQISALNIADIRVKIAVAGAEGAPLGVEVKTADTAFDLRSQTRLVSGAAGGFSQVSSKNRPRLMDAACLEQKLAALEDTEFELQSLDLAQLPSGLYLPFRELSAIRKQLLFLLRGSKEPFAPVEMPRLRKLAREQHPPGLSVLISSAQQLEACRESAAELYFELPSCFTEDISEVITLFQQNPELTPWFPAVLIGKDYAAAVHFLQQLHPPRIVSNNSGIAYQAYENGIDWVAGPYLNSVNSFSLLCLQENFNCAGAFISNELSRDQLKNIVCPDNFSLHYSIYHPQLLMTSRQCLQQQIEGCDKSVMDDDCLQHCHKSSTITNLKGATLCVDKTRGCYHRVFSADKFLNLEIVRDLPKMFTSFLIDLTEAGTTTETERDKTAIISSFERLLNGELEAEKSLVQRILPTANDQYFKGI